MSPEKKKLVQAEVARIGALLYGRLPPVEGLMRRNAYAHLWKAIKDECGKSYKDLPDDALPSVMECLKRHENDGGEQP